MSVKQSCCVHSQHDHEGSLINNTDFVTSVVSCQPKGEVHPALRGIAAAPAGFFGCSR